MLTKLQIIEDAEQHTDPLQKVQGLRNHRWTDAWDEVGRFNRIPDTKNNVVLWILGEKVRSKVQQCVAASLAEEAIRIIVERYASRGDSIIRALSILWLQSDAAARFAEKQRDACAQELHVQKECMPQNIQIILTQAQKDILQLYS